MKNFVIFSMLISLNAFAVDVGLNSNAEEASSHECELLTKKLFSLQLIGCKYTKAKASSCASSEGPSTEIELVPSMRFETHLETGRTLLRSTTSKRTIDPNLSLTGFKGDEERHFKTSVTCSENKLNWITSGPRASEGSVDIGVPGTVKILYQKRNPNRCGPAVLFYQVTCKSRSL